MPYCHAQLATKVVEPEAEEVNQAMKKANPWVGLVNSACGGCGAAIQGLIQLVSGSPFLISGSKVRILAHPPMISIT